MQIDCFAAAVHHDAELTHLTYMNIFTSFLDKPTCNCHFKCTLIIEFFLNFKNAKLYVL